MFQKPTFVSTALHARPLEGRSARLRDGRRPLVIGCADLESEIAQCAEHSDTKYMTNSQSPCVRDVYANNMDTYNTTEKEHSQQLHSNWQRKEPDMRKITDTEQSEALYRRQLTPVPFVLGPNKVYNDECQPFQQDFESPYRLSKQKSHCNSAGSGKTQNNQSLSHCNNINTLQTQGITNIHGRTLPSPSLQELQDSFSRSQAHTTFHKHFPENAKDLRENYISGKRHKFYGLHSFYFHN